MHLHKCALVALIMSSPVAAQIVPDLATATAIPGKWTYNQTNEGSEARFTDTSASPQLIVSCIRSTRHVTVTKPARAATPFLNIWTSSQQRSIASRFNPATGLMVIELEATDPLLDAIATSRGRIGVAAGSQPPLVAPAWPELARVVEDCRV